MTNSVPEVFVCGELFVDLILSGFQAWPEPGKEVFAKEFRREIGGGAAITASGLAKLGTRCAVFGVLGADSIDWFLERLNGGGVETSYIEFDTTEPTAFTVVGSTPQDRAFLTYAGANRNFESHLLRAAEAKRFIGARHIHLACAPKFESAGELFHALRANGCSLSLDVGWHEEWLAGAPVIETLRKIDIFFPNEVEAGHLTGEEDPRKILRAFAAAGLKRVALKCGSRGAGLLWDGECTFVDAHPVAAIDTTGAGDCFDAGFLHAMLRGESPEICLRTANICAALSTEAFGGIAGFPTFECVKRELVKASYA